MTDTDTTDLVTLLRFLVRLADTGVGPYAGYAAQSFIGAGREAADTIERLTRERDEETRWTVRFEKDLRRTMLALGDRFTLALPDGGDVHPHEAAKAAIDALAAAEARVADLEATLKNFDEDRLEEIITDSIDLDWTPRTAARAIVRAMKGASDE
jgi:hypothetical protein